ncbi:MarR family transcriptional regulator, partial [Mycobacterium tuberculosis]|nr:MarR family transcriptional regulator [Mycobacterium tuberculosis]
INYLSPDEIHTMVLVARHGQIKNEDLQSKLVTHRVDIGKMLKGLVEKGLLTSHGYGRSTYYNLFKESENNNFKNTSSSLSLVDNTTSLVDNTTSLVDNTTSLV